MWILLRDLFILAIEDRSSSGLFIDRSFFHLICTGKGNDALAYLNKLFGRFLSVNTLYRESGPVIETPLSGAQSIHDMLLQSWGGKIRVFPAVPDAWQDVALTGCGQKELSRSLPIGKPGKRNLYR